MRQVLHVPLPRTSAPLKACLNDVSKRFRRRLDNRLNGPALRRHNADDDRPDLLGDKSAAAELPKFRFWK